jgi:hydrogenase expression/formation protein HypD
MKFIDEFRDKTLSNKLVNEIDGLMEEGPPFSFMEVCGSHTMSIFRNGIKTLLPGRIKLVSGPGCPVCVTPVSYIDYAIALSRFPRVIITTFGDMLRVPGSENSLDEERGEGSEVKVVYSPLDAVKLAGENPDKEIVFLGIGFETTAPTIAASIIEAKKRGLSNFSVLSAHKTMPRALRALVTSGEIGLDGFILPAHVTTIIGLPPYFFLARDFKLSAVVAGFEPLDILEGIWMLIKQRIEGRAEVENQYRRVVRHEGNKRAQELIYQVFEPASAEWRGLGVIPGSGLRIRERYRSFDAERRFDIDLPPSKDNPACLCGEVIKGTAVPTDCPLYGESCRPEHPIGPCMVSSEGTCAAYYKYEGINEAG